jgi:hypothetical protein
LNDYLVQQLPGQLSRWRALWLLVGRPLVLVPVIAAVLAALARQRVGPVVVLILLAVLIRVGYAVLTGGRRVGRKRRPELGRLVAETAAAVGTRPPARIGLVKAPVVRATVVAGRGTLLVGAPLLDRLDTGELRALIAHELSVLARPNTEIILYRLWSHAVSKVDPNHYDLRVTRELDEFSAAVEQYADHAAGHLTEPATAARAVARAWLVATSAGMPVRTVEWSPTLALRVARRHPDLTEALVALVGTELTTAPTGPLVAV